jgi:dienelactone hydrolase
MDRDLRTRSFELTVAGETVPGALWTLAGDAGARPLVLAGHGFTTHKRALYPATLAPDLVQRGFIVAAIDMPGHGERLPRSGNGQASDRVWREHWRKFGATRIAAEWRAALDELAKLPEIDGARVGYWGLSLATQYGVGFLAEEPRMRAAVLGLSALPEPGPRIAAYAQRVTCPLFFIHQLDDEIAARDRSTALFDLLASPDKTLRASPGAHMDVPTTVFEEAYAFLAEHLTS